MDRAIDTVSYASSRNSMARAIGTLAARDGGGGVSARGQYGNLIGVVPQRKSKNVGWAKAVSGGQIAGRSGCGKAALAQGVRPRTASPAIVSTRDQNRLPRDADLVSLVTATG